MAFLFEEHQPMSLVPINIKALREEHCFELQWPDGSSHRLPFRYLREECPCARCVDENTGIRILDPATISEEIEPVELGYIGNYALKISWSDGHDTGLFTWERLHQLGLHVQPQVEEE